MSILKRLLELWPGEDDRYHTAALILNCPECRPYIKDGSHQRFLEHLIRDHGYGLSQASAILDFISEEIIPRKEELTQ